MKKAERWTYLAPDYLHDNGDGTWTMGLLNAEGQPYECPLIEEKTLLNKARKIFNTAKFVRVTVDFLTPLNLARQNPILVDIQEARKPPRMSEGTLVSYDVGSTVGHPSVVELDRVTSFNLEAA